MAQTVLPNYYRQLRYIDNNIAITTTLFCCPCPLLISHQFLSTPHYHKLRVNYTNVSYGTYQYIKSVLNAFLLGFLQL